MKFRHLNQLLEVFGNQIIHSDFKGEKEDFLIFNLKKEIEQQIKPGF